MATTKRARFMVEVASDDTQASELRQLRKMVDRIPGGSYLGMLFTDGLYDWAERRMAEDWSLDLHAAFEYWSDQATSAKAQASQLERSHETLRKAYEQANAPVDVSDLTPQKVETKPGELDVSSWRVYTPILDKDKCIGCKRCYILCPEVAISMIDGKAEINYKSCKGCGVCTEECPVKAIDFVQETI